MQALKALALPALRPFSTTPQKNKK